MSQEVHKKLIKKIFYKGTLVNKTAFKIGSSEGDFIDSMCLKDKFDKPYISATSLAGVLKSELGECLLLGTKNYKNKKSEKSRLVLNDCYLDEKSNYQVSVRNGVKIDPTTNIAEDKALFDYEVISAGSDFVFESEINIYENDNLDDDIKAYENILQSEINIGAKTMSGLGRFAFKDTENNKLELKKYEFSFPNDFEKYKDFLNNSKNAQCQILEKQDKKLGFIIKIDLDITNSLLIGSVNNDDENAKVASLKENGKFIASGASFKGAIKNQALKIANTFNLGEDFIDELFGYAVDKSTETKKAGDTQKSRVRVSESEIKNAMEKLHQRNKIDRFSGATIDGALFDAKVLYDGKINLNIELKNPSPKEKALMLFVARDLCTGFLAVGGGKNVGRGVFKGKFNAYENGKEFSKSEMNEIAKELLK